MRRDEFNSVFRTYAKDQLTPTEEERRTLSSIYSNLKSVLGAANCLQIGSYPRFTAVSPVHDLDVLYILGPWHADAHDPSAALNALEHDLTAHFENPTAWSLRIELQTHSVSLIFTERGREVLSVDVVPAYVFGRNEFAQDMYFVPEILRRGHQARRREYRALAESQTRMQWIRTDPRGYIEVARVINDGNEDFRKAVKFVKAWHYACKASFDSQLKSFHIEQLITQHFARGEPDIFEGIYRFFIDLPEAIRAPQIRDRADSTRFIDEYVGAMGFPEKRNLREARDGFLIQLESFAPGDHPRSLIGAPLRERRSQIEAYLFDQQIPVFTERKLSISGEVLPRSGGFRGYTLDAEGHIEIDRKIRFRLRSPVDVGSTYKWKVKNDDSSPQPRGEISDHGTPNDPERTAYDGDHYVECFQVRNGVCIARARQPVRLRRRL